MSDREAPPPAAGAAVTGAAWAAPIERLDASWQRLEARLCAAVLVAEIASLTAWVSLKGLSTDFIPGGSAAGLVYRAIVGAAVLGAAAHLAFRNGARRPSAAVAHRIAVSAAIVAGALGARLWAHVGVAWSSNALNWLQNASVLMLVGGLRGLSTRFTLWLALIGASLATSRGRHIHVDVVVRLLSPAARARATVAGWLAAALVCAAAVVGFVDHIGIAEYRASAATPCPDDPGRTCDTTPGAKLRAIGRGVSADLFLLGRQASLDLRSFPRVLAGRPYDRWMTAAEWNAWLDGADWAAHFGPAADALRMDPSAPSAPRMPQVTVPGTGEEARGLLSRDLDFVFPFGLAVIALKFVLRVLLAAAGRVRADRDEAEAEVLA